MSLSLACLLGLGLARHAICQATPHEAVTAIERAFRRSTKPRELTDARHTALRTTRGIDTREVATALLQAYTNLELEAFPIVQKRQRILLSDNGERLQALRDEYQEQHRMQDEILEQLTAMKSPEALDVLQDALTKKRLPLRLRIIGARAAASRIDSKSAKRLAKSLPGLLLVLEGAKSLERSGREFAPVALDALGHADPIARVAAIHALETICVPESIEALIAFLESDAAHATKVEAARALCILTGFELGVSPVSWRAWLAKEGRAYVEGKKRLGEGKPGAGAKQDGAYYFGIPLDRSSILFVHDNSLSMNQKHGDGSRLQASVKELERALDSLGEDQRFNIVLLANRVWAFEESQVQATKKNIARAKDWLRYQPVELGTAIHNALEAAFVLAGRGAHDRYYEPEIDTIFLLTDGLPTPYLGRGRNRGADGPRRVESVDDILRGVDRWNAFDRITIHTILIGGRARRNSPAERDPSAFLAELAKQNGGRFERIEPAKTAKKDAKRE
ncbi:MAG: VWA domain-containing protein [Planctomycetes bacterium]|nr:VWA domain-containing protein [Planctomycetota bacterium]